MGQRLPRPPRAPAGHRGSLPASPAVPGGCPAAPLPEGACPRRACRGGEGARDARRGHSALGDLRLSSEPVPAHWPWPAPQPGPRLTYSQTYSRSRTGHRKCGDHASARPWRFGPSGQGSSDGRFRLEAALGLLEIALPCARSCRISGWMIGVYLLEALQITLSVWEEIRVNRFCSCSVASFGGRGSGRGVTLSPNSLCN